MNGCIDPMLKQRKKVQQLFSLLLFACCVCIEERPRALRDYNKK